MVLTPGIIGGIGPESTITYYRRIISEWRSRTADGSWPTILINSIDLKRELDLLENDLPGFIAFMADAVRRVHSAGAHFALFASNTPHVVFDEVQRSVNIPLLHIADAARDAAKRLGVRNVALFGTRFTMESSFYNDRFAPAGIRIVLPNDDERRWIHDRYFGELVINVFRQETRDGMLAIVNRMKRDHGIDGVLLAGTELPLLLQDNGGTGVPFLDTATIHADAVVARMLS
jgi:aspartate racemase